MQEKPILYVDVDGVISLWGFDPNSRPPGAFAVVDGIPHFLSSEAGAHLLELAGTFDLVWCTGWEEKANEHLVPALGLPTPLPFLSFDEHRGPGHTTPGHWKLGALDAHAPSRPAAWVDDAFNEACFAWASSRSAPTLLVSTEPAVGLVESHAAVLRDWARALVA
ncbi:MAG TPA: HAD domain-containing protein [Solirubrobacteraceae bacterium]|nr:HAD domain-containing protein [Solirubrobacteraceae bacterium]